ncbi:hypothetical protein PR048_025696 [Dryococelus australis]|uniref:Uncharacterized protein n=1 Tax=Dryococelus australis TaxID=614101 RepID=A0ABQ9GJA4_9NEOP|nr:hypothetical protein PR048_025696 [Dryococelus australis]
MVKQFSVSMLDPILDRVSNYDGAAGHQPNISGVCGGNDVVAQLQMGSGSAGKEESGGAEKEVPNQCRLLPIPSSSATCSVPIELAVDETLAQLPTCLTVRDQATVCRAVLWKVTQSAQAAGIGCSLPRRRQLVLATCATSGRSIPRVPGHHHANVTAASPFNSRISGETVIHLFGCVNSAHRFYHRALHITEVKRLLIPRTPAAQASKLVASARNMLGRRLSIRTHRVVQLSDWLKLVLVRINCLRTNHESSVSELRNSEWRVKRGNDTSSQWRCGNSRERLARSPPTKAIRVQSPAEWESCRTMPLVGGFSRGSPYHLPPLHSGAAPYSLQPPSSALKTSLLRAIKISSLLSR